jgi:hypothetical protein
VGTILLVLLFNDYVKTTRACECSLSGEKYCMSISPTPTVAASQTKPLTIVATDKGPGSCVSLEGCAVRNPTTFRQFLESGCQPCKKRSPHPFHPIESVPVWSYHTTQ